MDDQQNPADAPSDAKSDDVRELGNLIANRRKELGIDLDAKPTQITPAMPAREMSAEQLAALEAEQARMAMAEQRARRQGMFAALASTVGERYSRCSFRTYVATSDRQKATLALCQEYAATLPERMVSGNGLVLYGPVGTGKDHLAFAVSGTAIMAHGKHVGWINGQDWYGKIRDEMRDDGQSEHQMIWKLVAPDLLVVSDPLPPIGSLTQHQATMLYRLVDARYQASKPTIVTVNVETSDEADTRMGVPVWDRIRHDAWEAYCKWPSYRKPARSVNVK